MIEQGVKELRGADGASGLGKYAPHLKPGIVDKDHKQGNEEVVITTPQSVLAMLKADPESLEAYDIILSDETQGLLGEVTQAAFSGVKRRTYGFTGSPSLSRKRSVSDFLQYEIGTLERRELVVSGNGSPVQHWICRTGETVYRDSSEGDFTQAERARVANSNIRHQLAADIGRAFLRDGRRVAFSCNTIDEANAFAEMMSEPIDLPDGSQLSVKTVSVHGGKTDNHETFRALQAGEIQAVTFVDIHTGWNVPALSCMVNLRVTNSEMIAGQRAARTSRRTYDEQGNLITAQIVDLSDTVKVGRRETGKALRFRRGQILSPALFGETTYSAGKVIADPRTDGMRRDFRLDQFPPHIQKLVMAVSGASLVNIPVFEVHASRKEVAPEGFVTRFEAAYGIGVTATQLVIGLEAIGKTTARYIDEETMDGLEKHFEDKGRRVLRGLP